MNLSQKLEILIGAKDEASKVLEGVKKTAADSMGDATGLGKYAKTAGLALAAVGTAALVAGTAAFAFTKSIADANMTLITLAEKTGISADTLKQYTYVADATETSVDAIATGFKKLSTSMFDAASGNKEQAKLFKALGIEVKDSNGQLRNAESVMLDVADRFKGIDDEATKSALAVKLFGKSGTDLIPMLNTGSEGIRGLTGEARALGLELSEKTVKQTLAFDEAMDKSGAAMTALKDILGNEMMPMFTQFINEVVIPAIPIVREALVTSWQVAKPAIELVGKALEAMGPTIKTVGEALKMSAEGWKAIFGWANTAWDSVAGSAQASIVSIGVAADSLPAKIEPGFRVTKEVAHAQLEGINTKFSGTGGILDKMAEAPKSDEFTKKMKDSMGELIQKSTEGMKLSERFKEGPWKELGDWIDKNEIRLKLGLPAIPPDFKETLKKDLDKAVEGLKLFDEKSSRDLWANVTAGLDEEHGFMDDLTTKLSGGDWKGAWGKIGDSWGDTVGDTLKNKISAKAQDIFGTGTFGQLAGSALSGALTSGVNAAFVYMANGFVSMAKQIWDDGFSDTSKRDRANAPPGPQGPGGITTGTEGISFGGPTVPPGPEDAGWARTQQRASAANFTLEEGPTRNAIRQVLRDYPDSTPNEIADYISSLAGVPFREGGWITKPTTAMMGEAGKEFVVSNRGVRALEALNQGDMRGFVGAAGNNYHFTFNISTLDPRGMRELCEGELGDLLVRRIFRDAEAGRGVMFGQGVINTNLV